MNDPKIPLPTFLSKPVLIALAVLLAPFWLPLIFCLMWLAIGVALIGGCLFAAVSLWEYRKRIIRAKRAARAARLRQRPDVTDVIPVPVRRVTIHPDDYWRFLRAAEAPRRTFYAPV